MKYEELKGKVAVITGAASGMGLLSTQTIARAGGKVVMCDNNPDSLKVTSDEILKNGGEVTPILTDVRSYADANRAAQTALAVYGKIDLLFCFAGGYEPRVCNSHVAFYEQPIEVIDWGLDVNLKGSVYFARACMPEMVKQQYGVIVVLGSVSGFEGNANGPMYGTAKCGLTQFVKGLALAGAPHNVRAVCVAPGPVMTRPGMAAMHTPLKRAAEPSEVVDFIFYLASKEAAFITGSTHLIDGGRIAALQY